MPPGAPRNRPSRNSWPSKRTTPSVGRSIPPANRITVERASELLQVRRETAPVKAKRATKKAAPKKKAPTKAAAKKKASTKKAAAKKKAPALADGSGDQG